MGRQVPEDWLEAVRDLLYELAHKNGELAQRAEALGQSFPEIMGEINQPLTPQSTGRPAPGPSAQMQGSPGYPPRRR